jgi:predicted nucleic acid-binding protein
MSGSLVLFPSAKPTFVLPALHEEVYSAARLKATYPISYADAFGASLAIRHGCPLMTGDHDFRDLAEAGVLQLEWLGA